MLKICESYMIQGILLAIKIYFQKQTKYYLVNNCMNAEAKASPQLRGCIDNIFKLGFLLFHPSTSTAIEARRKNK